MAGNPAGTVRGYNEFYNLYKEIWEASYGEKKKTF